MARVVALRNAADTFVNQNKPTKNFGQKARLYLRAGSSLDKQIYIFFTRPWPPGATITDAKLRLYGGTFVSGSTTLTVQRASAKWSVNKITWDTKPGVTGATVSVNKTDAPAGTEWQFDITALVQAVADGAPWYGFRVITTNSGFDWWHSAQANKGAYRPALDVTWSDAPEAPDELMPGGDRSVSLAKPILRTTFVDLGGDTTMSAMQVQLDALNDFSTGIDFDSGEVATSIPQVDLNATAYVGLADTAGVWWRARVKDGAGIWSAWSVSDRFYRNTKGVLTITNPSGGLVYEPAPVVTWTFTGKTQRAYQVAVSRANDANNWLWDSGKVTSTATNVTIPWGVLDMGGDTYHIVVRIWDTINREVTPNDPAYVEASSDFTIAFDGLVAAVTGLGMTSDAVLPIAHLTWSRSVIPDSWIIQRSEDAGTTWENVEEVNAGDLSTGGTGYAYDDTGASMYKTYTWRVMAVVGGHMSGSNPTVNGSVRRLAPFLMRKDGTDAVCFLNPKRTRQYNDYQELYETLGGSEPVLVTQKFGRLTGHVEGIFADDILTGVTAYQMMQRFKSMRQDTGVPLRVAVANETIKVVAYNFQWDVLTATSGINYFASFDWAETSK